MGRFHQRWEIFDDIRTCKTFWDVLLRLIRFDMENKICSKGKSSTPKWCFFSVISIAMLDNMFKRQIIDPSWCFFLNCHVCSPFLMFVDGVYTRRKKCCQCGYYIYIYGATISVEWTSKYYVALPQP